MSSKTKLDVWNIDYIDSKDWEEVPAKDLWQDGELTYKSVMLKIYGKVCVNGHWKIIRRKK